MTSHETCKPPRRRWQFTLRAVLLSIFLVALVLGLLQARRQWQAAHFVRVETSGGRQLAPDGQLNYDLVVKLWCSRHFTCNVEHRRKVAGIVDRHESVAVLQARPTGPRSSDRYCIAVRIVCSNGTVSVFPDVKRTGTPVFSQCVLAEDQGLRASNITGPHSSRSLAIGAPLHVLHVIATYNGDSGSTYLRSDDLTLRAGCLSE